jgi:cell division protein FtsL
MRKYSTKNSKKAKRLKWKKMFLSTTFRVVLLALIAAFGIIYLIEMNSISTSGYQISKLKNKINKLETKNRQLRVKIAQKKSLQSITKRVKKYDFIQADKIAYIETKDNKAIAKK